MPLRAWLFHAPPTLMAICMLCIVLYRRFGCAREFYEYAVNNERTPLYFILGLNYVYAVLGSLMGGHELPPSPSLPRCVRGTTHPPDMPHHGIQAQHITDHDA
eukprot:scaffold254006_cov27-Tisochrysis_lutea.AAC.1